ncbi:hypothetical protein [Herminiimonas arsenitoxidans]|uniref:hypothetical protein n=1 Tax=Herminiimonas arsenitoxidans TaxID=1809410 RepID=UPI00097127EB|nr:hypothetical protein [Herminiimonas arsenitoxidans]
MILIEIGMIASDTSRSRAYLQALIRNNLLPNFVILLRQDASGTLPGQINPEANAKEKVYYAPEEEECWSEAHFDPTRSILLDLNASNIPYEVLETNDINHPLVSKLLSESSESTFIYSGVGGVLLRRDVLASGKNFLHVHGGYLPDYKGSTTNFYSLLVDETVGASSLFLVEEIDSGPVILRRKFPAPNNRLAIDHIYDSAARAKILVETLQNYVRSGFWTCELEENSGGETYYIIHPVLKHIAILDKGGRSLCE